MISLRTIKARVRPMLPDAVVAIRMYRAVHGKYPNILNPSTFNEKVLFRKIFDRRPVLSQFHDKVAVRGYVAERLGAAVLPRLLFVGERPDLIPFDDLPGKFVVKPSHASGMVVIVTDKNSIDRAEIIEKCQSWLRVDYYLLTREWVYKGIPRRIMVEEYIDDGTGDVPNDLKFFVFDGKVQLIQVDASRFTGHRRTFFDTDWNQLAFTLLYEKIPAAVPRPRHLAEMVAAAECLADGLDFIRVDLYDTPSQLTFGELSACPESGLGRFHPADHDRRIGALWRLTRPGWWPWPEGAAARGEPAAFARR